METNSREINVEISGVPMESNENCGKIIQKLAALMKVENFDKNSIDVAHHLKTDPCRTPAIIVKFTTRTEKGEIWKTLQANTLVTPKRKKYSLPVDAKIIFKETRMSVVLVLLTKNLKVYVRSQIIFGFVSFV